MNVILQNLNDPSWWFTGLFFIVIAYAFPKFIQLFLNVPNHINVWQRKLKLKRVRRIKAIRFDETKVIIEGMKVSIWQAIFVLVFLLFIYFYLTTAFFIASQNSKINQYLIIIYAVPVYFIEFIWLLKDKFFDELLHARDRVR